MRELRNAARPGDALRAEAWSGVAIRVDAAVDMFEIAVGQMRAQRAACDLKPLDTLAATGDVANCHEVLCRPVTTATGTPSALA